MTKAERDKRYAQSEKGRANQRKKQKKYRQTEKGKAVNSKVTLAWQSENRDRVNETNKKYRQSEKGKEVFRIKTHRYRAKKKDLPRTLTVNEWKAILESQDNKCNICGISFEEVRATQDHIIPVSKGGAYTKENIQGLCQKCNSSKSNKL